ncbi:MAG: GNAT family N-acetyltransferase [Phycisphaerae bacterium]|nr:GNAT family N-acetyltransferase [Phycisphaerae bacterium]
MPDMLVPLYKLPADQPLLDTARRAGIVIRRANPWELQATRTFIQKHFSIGWADETSVGFANKPVSVFLAIASGAIVGFAAYECTRRGFFGPTGVARRFRGRGIGRALLLAGLHGLREMGYAYAVIGGAGPTEFYRQACAAMEIPDSSPGIYAEPLQPLKTGKKPRSRRR